MPCANSRYLHTDGYLFRVPLFFLTQRRRGLHSSAQKGPDGKKHFQPQAGGGPPSVTAKGDGPVPGSKSFWYFPFALPSDRKLCQASQGKLWLPASPKPAGIGMFNSGEKRHRWKTTFSHPLCQLSFPPTSAAYILLPN